MIEYKIGKVPKGLKHSVWSVLDAALYPMAYMASVPLMMKALGVVPFGLWVVLNTIITVLQLFNFNLGITAIRNVSYELANDNVGRVNDVINAILQFTALLLLVVMGIGFFLSYAAVEYNWWNVRSALIGNVSQCILLAAGIAGLKYIDQVFQNIIKAQENFKLAAILNMIHRFGLLTITLVMAVKKGSIIAIFSANLCFSLFYLIIQYACIKWVMPFFKLGAVKDKTQYGRLLNFSVWPWLQSIIVVLTFQTDRFWVSTHSGLSTVSGYGLVSTMFNHIHVIFTAIAIWILPRIAAMTSKGHDPANLYNTVRGGLLGVVIISLLFFYFISPTLFHFWVGEETYGRMSAYIRGFVGFEMVFAHTIMPIFYLNASGKEKIATRLTLLYCSVCYLFMLTGLFGFHSPVAMIHGMTIAMCITMPAVNAVVHRQMAGSYSWDRALAEMMPMYAGLLLIYTGNVWLCIALVMVIIVMLWKYYLSSVLNKTAWKQAPHM
jgi:O-antigen/teichoic acid export membrane protein